MKRRMFLLGASRNDSSPLVSAKCCPTATFLLNIEPTNPRIELPQRSRIDEVNSDARDLKEIITGGHLGV